MLRASVVLAVLAAVSSLAQALPVEHSGVPAKNIEPIGHYGLDVSTKRALKALTPEGWGVYLHKDAKLPDAISWSHSDTWLSALQTFSDRSGLRVDVDWNAKAIYIKPAVMPAPLVPSLMSPTLAAKPFAPVAAAGKSGSALAASPSQPAATKSDSTAVKVAENKPAPSVTLKLTEGQLISMALGSLAAETGWTLRWEAADDFEVASAAVLTGETFRDVLEKTLVRMGLSADWYPDSKVAVVSKKS